MHDIDMTVTGGAFAAVREPAWHKLGYFTDQPTSPLALLQAAHCDFQILKAPVKIDTLVEIGDGFHVRYEAEDPRHSAIYRPHPETGDPQILGIASNSYPTFTPRDILVGASAGVLGLVEPTASACGALDEGRQVFMSYELPEGIKVGGLAGEVLRLWLVIHTSFDGSAATSYSIRTLRAVCANTLEAGKWTAKSDVTFKKTSNLNLAAKQAELAVNLIPDYLDSLDRHTENLLGVHISNAAFEKLITENWGPKDDASKTTQDNWERKANQLRWLFAKADTQANVRHTGWAAVNAVGEYMDWYSTVRGDQSTADARRFARSLGLGDNINIVADPKALMTTKVLALA